MRNARILNSLGLGLLAASAAAYAQTNTPATATPDTGAPTAEPPTRATGTGPDTPTAAATASTAKLSPADRKFLRQADLGGLTEVQEGQIAQQQGSDPGVKSFGQQMVSDHQQANDDLKSLAQQKGVTLPSAPDARHQQELAALQKKQGAAFDHAYARQEVKDHQATIALFEQAAKSRDPDISAFAQKTLPTLQHHLEMARELNGAAQKS
jgi:putative membrane protein